MSQQTFEISADYFMIHLCDDELQPNLPEDVTDAEIKRRLRVEPHILVIHTARNMTVPVIVEVHAGEPPLDLAAWDHVTEGSLEAPSSRLMLGGTTDYAPDCPRIILPAAGTYRIRVLHSGLDTLRDNDLDGDDRYHFSIWPAPFTEWRILKQYAPAQDGLM